MTEERLVAIEGRLAVAYASYNAAQGVWEMQGDVRALVAALRAARAALGEIAAHNPYLPEVFAPLTAHEEEAIRAAIRASGVRHPLDRTYAEWGRHIGRQYADMARRALGA